MPADIYECILTTSLFESHDKKPAPAPASQIRASSAAASLPKLTTFLNLPFENNQAN